MRIWMMGTGPFAVPTFRWLLQSPHKILGLITQPIRQQKPGIAKLSPMRQVALDAQLPIHDPDSINTDAGVQLIAAGNPDLLVVCDYGQILKPPALQAARLGGINLHGSLLPRYRGAAPVNWAIFNGDHETGVTVIHMTPQLDAGPCLVRETVSIGADENAVQLEARLADVGVRAVQRALEMLESWDGFSPLGEKQDAAQASRAPRLNRGDGRIDWQRPADAIKNQVRALVPWPGTYSEWTNHRGEKQRLIVHRVAIEDAPPGTAAAAGEIVEASPARLTVMAGDGRVVSLLEVQPAGKKVMPAADFVRGYRLAAGQRLG